MSCPQVHCDGAYVLGALSPAERTEYEAHLAGCAECSASVAKLAPMPGLLGRVDPAALHPPEARASRLGQLLQALNRQRRRQVWVRRWQLAAAAVAAAVLAVTGSAVWFGAFGEQAQDAPVAAAMEPVASVTPVAAEVSVAPAAGGTEVWISCWYVPTAYQAPGRTFRLVAVGADGSSEQLGSWEAGAGDEVTLTGLTRFSGADLVRLEVRDGAGDTLLARDLPADAGD